MVFCKSLGCRSVLLGLALLSLPATGKVKLKTVTPQTEYAATRLAGAGERFTISIDVKTGGPAEGFTLVRKGRHVSITGNDGSGAIYGANRLLELLSDDATLADLTVLKDSPRMVLRGTCIGLQKTEYLPGHTVYEYPYTPENFPWFYDKEQWTAYLDMLAANNMNSLYLWNGHPFASLVRLDDYPFALEVDEETFRKNEDIFTFLTEEAGRRGIRIIQMFYNIILSKPFADHYGLKTQDRHRSITPLISDYTRKSIAAFVEKYPNVGFLVCLGEAISGIDDDVKWMTETIIPGIKDGLERLEVRGEKEEARGKKDVVRGEKNVAKGERGERASLPPIILRAHDTDGPRVLRAALPLYPNIYTMSKYTGESLTTYEPGGPWGETHRALAAAAPVHIDNVHILANLEPWRWSSPAFIEKTVQAMHRVHHSRGLHLYPQASYWDWPYTADRLPDGRRLRQTERDWIWYKAWGRYAWNDERGDDRGYWTRQLADYYGLDTVSARHLLAAYDESGEIAPKLLRRFGITEGNRQTLLLGMKMAQLVNPYKFNVYPGFYESCGPAGEKLIEYVERELNHQPHAGELPLDIVAQCVAHGRRAAEEMAAITATPARHAEELARVRRDMACYALFASSFYYKVLAAEQVLAYKWTKDVGRLEAAVPLLQESLDGWERLCRETDEAYLYANSMQTAQRRIPVGGDGGRMKTWRELLPVYQQELDALKWNIERLKRPAQGVAAAAVRPAEPATGDIKRLTVNAAGQRLNGEGAAVSADTADGEASAAQGRSAGARWTTLQKGAILFENRPDTPVDSVAPELVGLQALVLNRDTTRIKGTTLELEATSDVRLLVGFFQDDDPKWAQPPKLETDATGNEYGQAEPLLANALSIVQMPRVNVHQYCLPAGRHTLRLPKGIIMVAGLTRSQIQPRDVEIGEAGDEVDWLFTKN